MKIAAITPTRGDRPQFLAHCKYLMQQQTRQPDKHYIIDYEPISTEPDLVPRIKKGIELAKADGMDYIFIIEEDDFYPPNYINDIINEYHYLDVVGENPTMTYHLKTNKYNILNHTPRS